MKYLFVLLFGFFFPIFSIFYIAGFDFEKIDIVKLHRENHLLFIIDTAPIVITSLFIISDYLFNVQKSFYEKIINTIPVDIAVFDNADHINTAV